MALKNINERLYADLQDPEFAARFLTLALEEGPEEFRLALRDLEMARRCQVESAAAIVSIKESHKRRTSGELSPMDLREGHP